MNVVLVQGAWADKHGLVWLPENDFVEHFAAGADPARARVLHAVRQPLTGSSFIDVLGAPAWRSLPTWFLVAQQDREIPAVTSR